MSKGVFVKEIYKNIFVGDVILPKSPLKSLNLYVIKSPEHALIIDSGFDCLESEECFFHALDELGVQKGRTNLYLTHLHADHSGLTYKFQQKYEGKVYCSRIDADYVNAMAKSDYFDKQLYRPEMLGLFDDGHFFDKHPAVLYAPKNPVNFTIVEAGEQIAIGEYTFDIIDIPGHTPGMTGLYEKKHQLLFSGDHILDKITPNISFWRFEYGDILGTYLNSLEKVYAMDVKMVFPSHRVLIDDHRRRIDELKAHHQERLKDILHILNDGDYQTVAEIAAKMHWDFRAKDFEDFPPAQKWFATGEAMAHLEHLRAKGLVKMNRDLPAIQYATSK